MPDKSCERGEAAAESLGEADGPLDCDAKVGERASPATRILDPLNTLTNRARIRRLLDSLSEFALV
jgi:hypothetical protein